MTIGYVSPTNPYTDRKAWSGLTFKVRESIERAGCEVVWIPYKTVTKAIRFWNLTLKVYCYFFAHGKRFLLGENFPMTAKIMAKTIFQNEDFQRCDMLFFPGGAQIAKYIKTSKPYIYYSGATVPIMLDYYWFDICHLSRKIAIKMDSDASLNAAINLKASKWAYNSLINDYGCNPKKCHIIEYGPAMDTSDILPIEPYKDGTLNIFFSGVDWERKNGDIAVKTVELLYNKGYDVHLYIAGIRNLPEYCKKLDFVTHVGFLNKNTKDGYEKYMSLYRKCHLLLVPTKAECAGVVFCEASAFGMPSYTYDTGGTTNYVIDGVNGRTISLKQGAEKFAELIETDLQSGKLTDFHEGALRTNKEILSWEAWSIHFKQLLQG